MPSLDLSGGSIFFTYLTKGSDILGLRFVRNLPKINKGRICRNYSNSSYKDSTWIVSINIEIVLFQNSFLTCVCLDNFFFIILNLYYWYESNENMGFDFYFWIKLSCIAVDSLLVLLFVFLGHWDTLRKNASILYKTVE